MGPESIDEMLRRKILDTLKANPRVKMLDTEDKRPLIDADQVGSITVYTVTFAGSSDEAVEKDWWFTRYVTKIDGRFDAHMSLRDLAQAIDRRVRIFSLISSNFQLLFPICVATIVCIVVLIFARGQQNYAEIVTTTVGAFFAFLGGIAVGKAA